MKFTFKNKKIAIFVLTVVMTICAVFVGAGCIEATAKADMVISGANVSQTYAVGYTIKLGQVSATINGTPTTANVAIKKDGVTIAKSTETDNFVFEDSGNYQIVYYAYLSGKYYNKVVDVTVTVKPYFDFSNMSAEYNLGDEIELAIDVVNGDSRVPATVSLSGPDGDVPAGKTHVFDMLGNYVLSARATIGGQEYFDNYTFSVTNNSYLDLLYVKEGTVEFEENVDAPTYRYDANGIAMKPVSGSIVRYANVVDLNNVDKNTNLMTFTTFLGGDYTNITSVSLILTDKYDAKNKVEIQSFCLSDSSNIFGKIIWGSISTGLGSNGKPSTTRYTTEFYNANFQNKFHTGTYDGKRKAYLSFSYDPLEKAFYGTTTGSASKMILDLDNPLHVGYGKEWSGWTNGEVYAEIKVVCAENSRILVTELFGQSLSGTQIIDATAPSIITETTEVVLPKGFVGKQYKIPAVTGALDLVEGSISLSSVRTQVSKLNSDGSIVDYTDSISNGSFVPAVAGDYRIEYYAQDSLGNKSIKLCTFTVEEADVTPVVTCPIPETAIVGSSLAIPETTITGLSKIVRTSIKYIYNGIELNKKAGDVVNFEEGGTFKIVYEFEDYVGNIASGEKVINLQVSDKPIIKLSGVPYSAVKGTKLYIPDFEAIDYNFAEGQASRYPARSITVNGVTLDSTRLYNVTQSAGERLTVVFTAGSSSETRYVDVIEAQYRSDYFMTQAQKDDTDSGVSFTFSEDSWVKLANPLYVNDETGFKINWNISEASDVKYFTYQLTDFYDYNKKIKIVFDVKENKLQLNDVGEWIAVSVSSGYGLTYNNFSYQLVGLCEILNYYDGMPFAGFGDMVIVEFGFSGVAKTSEVTISTLGRATLVVDRDKNTNEKLPYDDTKAAPIVLRKTPAYENGILTVYPATAWKLFSGQIPVTVTLKKPSGGVITQVDGVTASSLEKAVADREYKVKISGFGWWTASYVYPKASEGGAAGGGGALTNTAKYNLADNSKITYKLGGSISTSVSVNKSIKLPSVQILTGSNVTSKYVVIEADGSVGIYEPSTSVTLKTAGLCRIVLVMTSKSAQGDAVQEATAHFEVNVKGAK